MTAPTPNQVIAHLEAGGHIETLITGAGWVPGCEDLDAWRCTPDQTRPRPDIRLTPIDEEPADG